MRRKMSVVLGVGAAVAAAAAVFGGATAMAAPSHASTHVVAKSAAAHVVANVTAPKKLCANEKFVVVTNKDVAATEATHPLAERIREVAKKDNVSFRQVLQAGEDGKSAMMCGKVPNAYMDTFAQELGLSQSQAQAQVSYMYSPKAQAQVYYNWPAK